MSATSPDFPIRRLGECRVDSPLAAAGRNDDYFVADTERVLAECEVSRLAAAGRPLAELPSFELAGPRRKIYFDPSKSRAGIVTCGGLCPGLNDVIREIVLELWHNYGVRRICGFRYGYQGFIPRFGHEVRELTPETVDGIQDLGGTILSSSRGEQDPAEVVDCLDRMGLNLLFTIGGDGTTRGAIGIAREIERRGLKIAVVGIPKTIDNDIMYVDESFGFQTAYSVACQILNSAHVEATGAPGGIGLVKLMGRHSGFIACHAALAMSDVNFVLIPEAPFRLEGENGFLEVLKRRIERRGHAVIVVAEGAGVDLLAATGQKDASGNTILPDIGVFLKEQIQSYFRKVGREASLKYIDPSYIIRSVPASPHDSVYCSRLARNAVHAALSGRTETLVSRWHGRFVHVPMAAAISERKQVDPAGELWRAVLAATGQPTFYG